MEAHESSSKQERKKIAKKAEESITYMCIPLGGISPIDGGDVQGHSSSVRCPEREGREATSMRRCLLGLSGTGGSRFVSL